MKPFVWAGLALQLIAAPAFAQSTPATTPSTPPVTTPPPPAMHPPTGGPNSMPTAEPANAIDRGAATSREPGVVTMHEPTAAAVGDSGTITPGANSFTESQARNRLERNGYTQVSALEKDQDGIWRGTASRNGSMVHVSVDFKGNIASN